jgi:hypothetical protein
MVCPRAAGLLVLWLPWMAMAASPTSGPAQPDDQLLEFLGGPDAMVPESAPDALSSHSHKPVTSPSTEKPPPDASARPIKST